MNWFTLYYVLFIIYTFYPVKYCIQSKNTVYKVKILYTKHTHKTAHCQGAVSTIFVLQLSKNMYKLPKDSLRKDVCHSV